MNSRMLLLAVAGIDESYVRESERSDEVAAEFRANRIRKRRAFAAAHLKPFGLFALAYAAFSAFMQLCGYSLVIDIAVFTVGIIAVAISTTRIKL